MNDLGTLWMHVGTHKTGTTSIQEGLQLRRAALEADGLVPYPDKNAWMLANLFIRPQLETVPRQAGRVIVPDRATFDAELAKMRLACRGPLSDVIVSSEAFCFLRQESEAEILCDAFAPLFSRIIPVVVFRNTRDWRTARRNQLQKTGHWEAQKALPDAVSIDGNWYYDKDAIVSFWQRVGPVVVIDYDAEIAAEGSILPKFARAIRHPNLFDGLDIWLNARNLPKRQTTDPKK